MTKLKKIEQGRALRLAVMLQSMKDATSDPTLTIDQRKEAANLLGETILKHFDQIVVALRVAGGAQRV